MPFSWHLNSDAVGTGFNVASMLLDCAVGAFFAGTLADKFERKPVLLVTAALFVLSAFGSGIASSSPEFIFYRILGGLAVGAASIIAPAYIGEIAPARYRGALISLQQLAIVLGLFFSFLTIILLPPSQEHQPLLYGWDLMHGNGCFGRKLSLPLPFW